MQIRPWIAGVATLTLAGPGLAVVKTYVLDADQSTRFLASDQRIYRGACYVDASTPNAGDDGPRADDQCRCTPGVNCAAGAVPVPTICTAGARVGLNCTVAGDCPGGACAPGAAPLDSCAMSEGRPNGGSCDPSIAFPGAGSCAPGFPTRNSPEPPCNLTQGGVAVINDTGNGTPTLVSLSAVSRWDDVLQVGAMTGIPGTTVALHADSTLSPAPNQMGIGTTASTILWGVLIGWTRSGELSCSVHCPGGCGPGAAAACPAFGTVPGKAPPWALKAGAFATDPWVFIGSEFVASAVEIVALPGVTESIQLGGRGVDVPLLPQVGLTGLAAGLAYLGTRAVRTRSARRAAQEDATGSDSSTSRPD